MKLIDRKDAGIQLAEKLKKYKDLLYGAEIYALPRGGVVVGYEIARAFHLPLDIICPRKIGAPQNPEFAIGAITETGEAMLSQDVIEKLSISPSYIQRAMEQEKEEARRRLKMYRQNRPPRDLKGKTILLVDDGLATGSTMEAAIKTVKAEKAAKILVAVPVAPPDTAYRIEQQVDILVVLDLPSSFYAVGQFYQQFGQVSDEEVITLLKK